MLRDRFPDLPLVAAFETGFHRTIPEGCALAAMPSLTNGRRSSASDAGASNTAPATATSATPMPELLGRMVISK